MRTGGLIYSIVWLLMVIGWVLNIMKLVTSDFSGPVSTEVILRIVGIIVAPLGGIMGYL